MNGSLRISVITPVFNREDVIGRCIQSVLDQDFDAYEHLVVDDASIDSSAKVVSLYCSRDPRVKLLRQTENRGVNYSRNRAIAAAKGEVVLLLDSDDELLPGALSTVAAVIEEYPEFPHYLFVPSDLEWAFKQHPILSRSSHVFKFEDWLDGSIGGDFIHVIRTPLARQHLFSEEFRIYEILDFLRIYKAGGTQFYTNRTITRRDRTRPDSISREYFLDNTASMSNYYRYVQSLVAWFRRECAEQRSLFVMREARKGVLLGLALGKNTENQALLEFLKQQGEKFLLLNFLNSLPCQHVIFVAIRAKSRMNRLGE
jgi:glycosyltransferase involved in cell wall biosynthesis